MFAAIGRISHRHRRIVVLAWLALTVVGLVVGSKAFARLSDPGGAKSFESIKGFDLLAQRSGIGPRVLAVVDGPPVGSPAVRSAVVAATTALRSTPGVARVHSAYDGGGPTFVARDGHASLVSVDLTKDPSNATEDAVISAVRAKLGAVPGATVTVGGTPVLRQEANRQVAKDLKVAEVYTIPAAAVVLVLVFGGLVSAGLPLAAAIVSIAGGLLIVYGFTFLWQLSPQVPNILTILGLGLAIDYGLLIVNRFREERLAGHGVAAAVERTVDSAGRAIAFSALTVMASLAGLFLFDEPTYRSMGAGGVAVVFVALLAALTLVPALLGSTAPRWLRLPSGLFRSRRTPGRPPGAVRRRIARLAAPPPAEGFFSRLTRRAQRRPVLVIVVTVGLLLAAGAPFLGARFKSNEPNAWPASFESRQVQQTLLHRFTGNPVQPVQVIIPARSSDPRVAAYAAEVRRMPGVVATVLEPSTDSVSVLDVTAAGDPQGPTVQRVVHDLRANRPPMGSYVSGMAAVLVDFKHRIATDLPWALLFIGLATFVLLFLMTGSVLIPLKALVMNVLSLSASFGALVWIFQDGHLSGLLGFTSTGALETWVPIIVFTFAFGLSMDYEVFLLSRVKEAYDAGLPNDEAVAVGLQRSGRIITSAALLMVLVFCGFAAGKTLGIKELGVAMTLAVIVDATLVRCLLVPATMTLLGDANWWAPAPLARIYRRFALREGPGPVVPAPRGDEAAGGTEGETEDETLVSGRGATGRRTD